MTKLIEKLVSESTANRNKMLENMTTEELGNVLNDLNSLQEAFEDSDPETRVTLIRIYNSTVRLLSKNG